MLICCVQHDFAYHSRGLVDSPLLPPDGSSPHYCEAGATIQFCGWYVYSTLLNKVLMQQCGPEVLLTQHKGLIEMQCKVQILVTVYICSAVHLF